MFPDVLRTVVSAAFVLGVLIFIHELGHYLAARWRGVHVDVFSIGFGRPLLRWRDKVGTEWRICALPLGGYVKPHGFEGEGASAEAKAEWQKGRTFHDKPVLSRMIVILAGPVFNLILAALLFAGLFAVMGKPASLADQNAAVPKVAALIQGSAAARAGMKPGDIVEAVDGVHMENFGNLKRLIAASPGRSVRITVLRDGHEQVLPVTVASVHSPDGATGQLGMFPEPPPPRHVGPLEALVAGVGETWVVMVSWVAGLWQLLTGSVPASQIGGTLRIAQMSGQVAAQGTSSFITFMALISVNLGMMNLLPIPMLDGGRLLFYVFEALLGRPVERRVQEAGFRAGLALILGLVLFTTLNDLSQFGLFTWLRHVAG